MFSIPSTCHGAGLNVRKFGLERQEDLDGNTPVAMPRRECHDENAPALVWMLGEGYCILLHERSVYACELHEYQCECEYVCELHEYEYKYEYTCI
jgi:hypothetical protein